MTDENSDPEDSVESERIVASSSVGWQPSVERRKLFRRLAALAGLGITGVLLSQDKTGLLPSVAAPAPYPVTSNSNTNSTFEIAVFDGLDDIIGNSNFTWDTAGGLKSTATNGGVQGIATGSNRVGVYGQANGTFGTGVEGIGSAMGVQAIASTAAAVPLVAQGASGGFEEIQFLTSGGTQLSRLHATGDGINRFAVNQSYDGTNFNLDNTADNGVSFLINSNSSASGIFAIQYIPAGSNPATSRLKSYLFMKSNGNLGIGTNSPDQLLSVNGNADKSSGGTSWGTFCDRRWKDPDSFRRFELGLDWVRTLPSPVRFRYAEGNGIGADPGEENVNFIAQDLQDGVHDNLVYESWSKVRKSDKEPTTMYGVNVNDMHFAVVNAIKELAEQNSELAEQNRILRDEIKLLKARLDASETIKLAAS